MWETIRDLVNRKTDDFERRGASLRVRVINRQIVSYTYTRVHKTVELQRQCRAHLYEDYGMVIASQVEQIDVPF